MAQEVPRTGTRLIIPSPRQTRINDGIEWYEVVPHPPSRSVHAIAWSTQRNKAAVMQTVVGEGGAFRTEILDGDVRMTTELTVHRNASGEIRIYGTVAGSEVEIIGDPGDPDSARSTGSFEERTDAERGTLQRWARLSEGFQTLAQATRNSYGCTSCLLILGGLGAGTYCCVMGNIACCAGTLIGGGTFVEQCGGACAPSVAEPEPVEFLMR